MSAQPLDVVVVGAGLAGLAAARRLREASLSVEVVEARDRVGGRLHTVVHEGATVDIGGQWIGPGQPRVYALAEELGLTTFPTPAGGRQVLDQGGTLTTYGGTIPRVGLRHLAVLQLALWRLEHLRRQVDPAMPHATPQAEWLDHTTVEAWARRALPSAVVRHLLRPTLRTVFGAEPGELSLLHLLHYTASAGGFERLIDVEGGFQQDRILEGAQALAEGLADRVGLDRLRLSDPVDRLEHGADGVVAHLRSGDTVAARRAVVAVPLALRSRIRFDPPLPPRLDQLHQRIPMGATVKFFAAYDRPFWRDAGLSGEAVCTDGPLSVTFDNTAPGGPPMLLGFVTGRPARDWSERPTDARQALLLDDLARYFGAPARDPLWTLEQDWSTEPFSGGCPISLMPPGTWTGFGDWLRRPVGPIHWAGTESAVRCTGFMEGALDSGEAAAAAVGATLR